MPSKKTPSKKMLYYFSMFFVLYEFTTYLSNDMIMPAMLEIVREFNSSEKNVALSLSFFMIGGSMLQIFLGPITDIIGKRKVMLGGNLLFLIATLIIPFTHTINQFLVARLFQGMGLCFIFIGYAMIHEFFNDVEAVKLTSILSNIAVFAPLIGPIIGSAIALTFNWQSIFIISGVLGIISLYGLYKYMPQGKITVAKVDIKQISINYYKIMTNKVFLLGVFVIGTSCIPLISWIGLSPTVVIKSLHQSFAMYIIYQSVIFSGFIVSSLLIQNIAGKFSFQFLIKYGALLALIGLILGGVFNFVTYLFIFFMFVYAFGFGLYNGAVVRIALTSTGQSSSLSSSALSLLNLIYLSVGLEFYNLVCEHFNYSMLSYALLNILVGIITYLCSMHYAKVNKNRVWSNKHEIPLD